MDVLKLLDRAFRVIIHMPKILYINFKSLPFSQAVHLPIILMSSCKLQGIKKNCISIDVSEREIHSGMIRIGSKNSSRSGIIVKDRTSIIFKNSGKIVFKGSAVIGKGSSVVCDKGAELIFGNKFSCNVNCFISCSHKIIFKDDVLLGWNVNIRDDDGHPIYNCNGEIENPPKSVILNSHVWVASYSDILKGVEIAQGVIIGYRSLVNKSITTHNCIAAGSPAKVVKENQYWEHR